ncbi:MAG: hypothetical protein HY301_06055 [Verrucomicrobia bacterium]|nr:hypothetical protein [Verrucomicrobiota bacterium]
MISQTNADFWACFNALPKEIQALARERFRLWQSDAFNAALHFKPLLNDVWSVRVNQGYRALGRRRENLIVWFWIGTHAEYDQLLKRL